MTKLTTARPGTHPYDRWDETLNVQYGPIRESHNGGTERDVYVNGEKIGSVERLMKPARWNLGEVVPGGWQCWPDFPVPVHFRFSLNLPHGTQVQATTMLVKAHQAN